MSPLDVLFQRILILEHVSTYATMQGLAGRMGRIDMALHVGFTIHTLIWTESTIMHGVSILNSS